MYFEFNNGAFKRTTCLESLNAAIALRILFFVILIGYFLRKDPCRSTTSCFDQAFKNHPFGYTSYSK